VHSQPEVAHGSAGGGVLPDQPQSAERLHAARLRAVWRGRAARVICDLLGIADLAPAFGAGIAFLVPGGLFELAFPLLLVVRGSSGRSDARLVPVSVSGAG
jgi:hypothetical protein